MQVVSLTLALSDNAAYTVQQIARKGETRAETICRILEALAATSPDFDDFYGEPADGKGPSGSKHKERDGL